MSVFGEGVVMSRVGVKFGAVLVLCGTVLAGGCAQSPYHESANVYSYDGTPISTTAAIEPVESYPVIEDEPVYGYARRDPSARSYGWTDPDAGDGQTYEYRGGRDPITGRARSRQ